MYKAIDIAYWCIARNNALQYGLDDVEKDGITNLKIQKLLFFIQGTFFTFRHSVLFSDTIEAWDYGPVVPNVYNEFQVFKNQPIDIFVCRSFSPDTISQIETDSEIRPLLVETFDFFNQFSAYRLVKMSHDTDGPWFKVYKVCKHNQIPMDENIEAYFRKYFLLE